MALPNDDAGQACSLARTLEVIGERWTLLTRRPGPGDFSSTPTTRR